MNTDTLIEEMQELKAKYPTLSIDQVLKVFEIQATRDLSIILRGIRQ